MFRVYLQGLLVVGHGLRIFPHVFHAIPPLIMDFCIVTVGLRQLFYLFQCLLGLACLPLYAHDL